mmetsp:Transcript_5986/g.9041  ORF Transcript_5986/g.9041 Transcript_5986/m.9041 type:complete len:90 (-) Transcript_5986:168-437(-)
MGQRPKVAIKPIVSSQQFSALPSLSSKGNRHAAWTIIVAPKVYDKILSCSIHVSLRYFGIYFEGFNQYFFDQLQKQQRREVLYHFFNVT